LGQIKRICANFVIASMHILVWGVAFIHSRHISENRGLLVSELHGVWGIVLGEGESGSEILKLHLVLELAEDS